MQLFKFKDLGYLLNLNRQLLKILRKPTIGGKFGHVTTDYRSLYIYAHDRDFRITRNTHCYLFALMKGCSGYLMIKECVKLAFISCYEYRIILWCIVVYAT